MQQLSPHHGIGHSSSQDAKKEAKGAAFCSPSGAPWWPRRDCRRIRVRAQPRGEGGSPDASRHGKIDAAGCSSVWASLKARLRPRGPSKRPGVRNWSPGWVGSSGAPCHEHIMASEAWWRGGRRNNRLEFWNSGTQLPRASTVGSKPGDSIAIRRRSALQHPFPLI